MSVTNKNIVKIAKTGNTEQIKVRQRAGRACLNCRILRVKCQLMDGSDKCKRCNLDEKECVFVSCKRGGHQRKSRKLKAKLQAAMSDNNSDTGTFINPVDLRVQSTKKDEKPQTGSSDGSITRGGDDLTLRKIQNPSDSMNILAQASCYDSDDPNIKSDSHSSSSTTPLNSEQGKSDNDSVHYTSFNERLSTFCLVKTGILTPITLKTLIYTYFSRHHQYMPIVQSHKVLRTDEELCGFIEEEPILAITFVIIAAKYGYEKIHSESWKLMSTIIQELTLGLRRPTLGSIEALLTLSENVPRCSMIEDKELYEFEERFSWHLLGQAVRMSYYLGLDQKTMLESDETMSAETHRMRYIWTNCYCEERETSIRFRKAICSRGPKLCFPGHSKYIDSFVKPESLDNFKTLIPCANSLEDFSSYTQALLENTLLLSNIHDLLYTSKSRITSLIEHGDYYKALDDLTMEFATYRITWEKKKWSTLSLDETVWISFNYSKLYAYGFAFEAHIKRMTDSGRLDSLNLFPMSMSAISDAKFIIEAKNAAIEIIKNFLDNLHLFGAMAYLPARYYGYFGDASMFLIKIVFTNAVNYTEQMNILRLISRAITCCYQEVKELKADNHPLLRYGKQLIVFLYALWSSRNDCDGNSSCSTNNSPSSDIQDSNSPNCTPGSNLNEEIFNLISDFSSNGLFSLGMIREQESMFEDIFITLFSNDLNSNFWLSFFNH